jgi:clan AA aspartic protease (TIGR02281 family)
MRCRALVLALLLVASPAWSEIYKWVDEQGRSHFAQDLHLVPERYREQARSSLSAPPKRDPIQVFSQPASMTGASRRVRRAAEPAASAGKVIRVPVERAGTMLRVVVRINDSVDAPFYIDTGASDVLLPRWVADRAGIDLAQARRHHYSTANGTVELPIVTLDSVDLRGARAEQVRAAVSDSIRVGLLGLAYFNHFRYDIDPARGIVTLRENGLVRDGLIRGGRSEAQWRAEFRAYALRRAAYEDAPLSHVQRRKLAELERQSELLEDEADDARVPVSWRD